MPERKRAEEQPRTGGRWMWLMWLPPALVIVAAGFLMAKPGGVAESPVVLTTLNALFVVATSLAVAYLAAHTYLKTAERAMLALGCAALSLGVIYLLAGPLVTTSIDAALVLHNGGLLVTAALFVVSAVWFVTDRPSPGRRAQAPDVDRAALRGHHGRPGPADLGCPRRRDPRLLRDGPRRHGRQGGCPGVRHGGVRRRRAPPALELPQDEDRDSWAGTPSAWRCSRSDWARSGWVSPAPRSAGSAAPPSTPPAPTCSWRSSRRSRSQVRGASRSAAPCGRARRASAPCSRA